MEQVDVEVGVEVKVEVEMVEVEMEEVVVVVVVVIAKESASLAKIAAGGVPMVPGPQVFLLPVRPGI